MKESSKYEYFYLSKFKNSIRIKIELLSKFIEYYEQFYIFKPMRKIQIFLNDYLYPNRRGETIEIYEIGDFEKANSTIILHKTEMLLT